MNRLLNILTGAVAFIALLVGAVRIYELTAPQPIRGEISSNVPNWQTYVTNAFYLGPSPAPVTIVEFSDFQCRYCQKAVPVIRAMRKEFEGNVAFVYRHAQLNPDARLAAIATVCAGQQGASEQMHDVMFARSTEIGKKSWTDFAMESQVQDTALFLALHDESPFRLDSGARFYGRLVAWRERNPHVSH